jgi:hypothetical protein
MFSPTRVLISITSCSPLGLLEPFSGTCFGHAFSKVCQNVCWVTICTYKGGLNFHPKMYYVDQKVKQRQTNMGQSLH